MNILLRLLAPSLALGAILLLGERPSYPPDEAPAAEMSAASLDLTPSSAPAPGFPSGGASVSPRAVRLPPAAAARLDPAAALPETRSLSPPFSA